nr:MAG TPA: hypothetical protein [Caudoviricetes sp.]
MTDRDTLEYSIRWLPKVQSDKPRVLSLLLTLIKE